MPLLSAYILRRRRLEAFDPQKESPVPTVNQTSNVPTLKVQAATALAAVASILSWADDKFWGDQVPGYIEAALITLAVFAAGYLKKNKVSDAPPAPGVPDGGYGLIELVVGVLLVLILVVVLLHLV